MNNNVVATAASILSEMPDLGVRAADVESIRKCCEKIIARAPQDGYVKDAVNIVFNSLNASSNPRAKDLAKALVAPKEPAKAVEPADKVSPLPAQPVTPAVPVREQKVSKSAKPRATAPVPEKPIQAPVVIVDDDTPVEIPAGSYRREKPFSVLFGPDPESMPGIVDEMMIRGFDKAEPVTIWKETNKLIDGHQRDAAATEAGLKKVWAIYKSFPDEDAALEYAIKRQTHRRNTDDATLIKLMAFVDTRKPHGGDRRSEATKASSEAMGRTAEKTAKVLGTSKTKTEKMRAILDAGDKKIVKDVETGRFTINAAHKKVRAKKESPQVEKATSPAKAAAKLMRVSEQVEPIAVDVRKFDVALGNEVGASGKNIAGLSERVARLKPEEGA